MSLWGQIKLVWQLNDDGFRARWNERCPYCHHKTWLGRNEERVCVTCSYGYMYPKTREKHGFGEPQVVEFEGRYQP